MSQRNNKSSYVPYVIISIFVLFGIMIFTMVYGAFQQDINLVRPDYYAQEVKYDTRIQEIKRTLALGDSVDIKYHASEEQVSIRLPKKLNVTMIKGECLFYRPSDSKLDFSVPLALTDEHDQQLNVQKLKAGLWKLKLSFAYDKKEYFKVYQFVKQTFK